MPTSKHRIAVIGLWHLGEIYSAGLAELGHRVVGISKDRAVIADCKNDVPPLAEPGLVEAMRKNRKAGRLAYSTDMKAVRNCDVVWITFDTPVNDRDESDLGPIIRALKEAVPFLKNNVLIVVSSQIPAGTSARLEAFVKKMRPRLRFHYIYSPENLRLGEALDCFLRPERIVVGASDDDGLSRMQNIFRSMKGTKLVRMSPASAEMTKHALNAFLATSISFINDIADACEDVGADVQDVIAALRSDPRIGQRAALGVGIGFSGGTLGRDLVALMQLARERKAKLPVIETVYKKNLSRVPALADRLEHLLGGLKGKKIVLFGLTYKPGTTTLRRSRALEVAKRLTKDGALLTLCDPHIPVDAVPKLAHALVVADPYEAAKDAYALVFITPWSDFKELDFTKIARRARAQAIVLDCSNLFYGKESLMKKNGFRYHGMGR